MSQSRRPQQRSPAKPPTFVDSAEGLAALVKMLSSQPTVAVDTESNSLYVYRERVCLLQFSVPGEDYLVDPLAKIDLAPLGSIFADATQLKIFHAAEYDVMCLKRDFGFSFANLFDTMWAARILGWSRVGLANILSETFDVKTSKRFQRYNWGKRPLDSNALAYARLDTHYLIPLRKLQAEALAERRRSEEAQEVFASIAATGPANNTFDPDGFWRIKGTHDLSRREQAVLRELYLWRDQEAARRDFPPFKILGDSVLSTLARKRPASEDDLTRSGGLSPRNASRYGRFVLRAIRRGERTQTPRPPSTPRPPEEVVDRFQALRKWRKKVAAERGVDVDVVLGNAVLWSLAKENPKSSEELRRTDRLGNWKREAYGEAILETLRSFDNRRSR
ncbi:MAG: ribonuclease D [Anaerolineales bacterium]|nr:MAG: ribonuclease D [Anaerolineales bacterium]